MAEDLAEGQFGEEPHGEDDPEHDLVGKPAVGTIASSGVREDLAQAFGADKFVKRRQAFQRVGIESGPPPPPPSPHPPPPPGLGCVVTPRSQRAVTCANRERYWA